MTSHDDIENNTEWPVNRNSPTITYISRVLWFKFKILGVNWRGGEDPSLSMWLLLCYPENWGRRIVVVVVVGHLLWIFSPNFFRSRVWISRRVFEANDTVTCCWGTSAVWSWAVHRVRRVCKSRQRWWCYEWCVFNGNVQLHGIFLG